jgi:hypothetical protein
VTSITPTREHAVARIAGVGLPKFWLTDDGGWSLNGGWGSVAMIPVIRGESRSAAFGERMVEVERRKPAIETRRRAERQESGGILSDFEESSQ